MKVDPTTLAVIRGWLQQIVDEMDEVLGYAAFSPTISEGHDRADGIYHDTGDVIAQGRDGLPIFIETMQDAVKTVIGAFGGKEGFSPGDVVIMNDPYRGGTHLMDVKFFKPVFRHGKLSYFVANTGHWPDIGGSTPGGFAASATETYQEGILIPPVKVYEKDKLNEGFLRVLLANIRTPEERLGDLKAQVGALHVGEQQLNSLLDKYGDDTVAACIDELEKRTEMQMRSYISEIPDGRYSATEWMDNDGAIDEPVRISLDLEVKGDELCFDLSNNSPPRNGPINAGFSCTASGIYTALKHVFPDLPLNAGMFKPVKIVIPKTTFLNASFPRPVSGAAAEITQHVCDATFSALAQAIPERLWGNAFGTINNIAIGGDDLKGRPYIMYIYSGGGLGAFDGGDGFINGAPPVGVSGIQPKEVFEQLYPVRMRQYSIREGSGGAGKYRGGFGAVLEIEFLGEEGRVSAMGDRGKFGPKGILGGKEAAKNEVCIIRSNGEKFIFPMLTKGETVIHRGDVISIRTPGGGGYGNPLEREREAVLKDVVKGFIGRETAEKEYNVTTNDEELEAIRRKL